MGMRRLVVIGLAIAYCIAGALPVVRAEEAAQQSDDRVDQLMGRYNLYPAFDKAGRGVSNLLGGWLEIPYNIQTRYSKSDTGGSLLTGLVHGLLRACVRTGVGAYEAVTFFLPYPENFAPILPTLPYYQKNKKHDPPLWE